MKETRAMPEPRFCRIAHGRSCVMLSRVPVFVGEALADKNARWALAPVLNQLGLDPSRVRMLGRDTRLPDVCIVAGRRNEHRELANVGSRYLAKQPEPGDEGYYAAVGQSGIRIVADKPAGVFYACQTVAQSRRRGAFPCFEAADAPRRPFRGIHLPVRDPKWMPQLKRLVSEVMPRCGANAFVMQLDYHLPFRSHPELREKTRFTRSQVRELVGLARRHNVKVVPLVNCYGHQGLKPEHRNALLRAYPEFNETPGGTDEPVGVNWCPSNSRVYKVVCDVIDELVAAFETDTVHLGMDEVMEFGKCSRCAARRKSNAEWYAHVVNKLHRHVVGRRKLKMLIWGDRLVDGALTPYNRMNGARNGTHPARELIPKDILLCDWHYHLHAEYPSVDQFEKAGFDYVICGWRKMRAVNAFLRYAHEHGSDHLKGVLATNWGGQSSELDYLVHGRAKNEHIRAAGDCFFRSMRAAWRDL